MTNPQVSYLKTTIDASTLYGRRREAAFSNTLPIQLTVLKQTGRYEAFKLQWHPSYDDVPNIWPVPNHLFWDSDVAKWIEGACYLLQWKHNVEVDTAVKEMVEMVRQAQQGDGYLNIHFTVVKPDCRFTNLRDLHELYNAGHLIEAALAHNQLYENERLLEPVLKYVALLCKEFGPGPKQRHGYPGHPEIELALLRLYRKTGDRKHLELARYFLEERGNPKGEQGRHFYEVEAERRGDDPNARPIFYPTQKALWYYQAHEPIVDQKTVEGHSVRAMYLLTAVTDLVIEEKDLRGSKLEAAVLRLWDNMVEKKMYLTGGIGAIKQYEGFGLEYFLPQGTDEGGCYSETCAAIGVMMLAERLLQINLHNKFADILELCFYNSVLTGISCDGRSFSYTNQLASSETDHSKREEWFTCACCPPNMLRILGYFGGYIWTYRISAEIQTAEVNIHMYMSSTLSFDVGPSKVTLKQKSNWPWEGEVDFELESSGVPTTLRIRIPGWASEWKITPNTEHSIKDGYLTLTSEWLAENPTFRLVVPMKPRPICPHPYTNQDIVAMARGPIVYCVEDADNPWVKDHFKGTLFNPYAQVIEYPIEDVGTGEKFIGLTVCDSATDIDIEGLKANTSVPGHSLGSQVNIDSHLVDLHFIPYYFRANRGGRGQMRVGLRRWR